MAGVRGEHKLFTPKGLPNTISTDVARAVKEWGVDAHSHTWFSIDDLWKISDEYEKLEGARYRNLDAILAMMMELETENNTPRLIVFFDN